MGGMALLSPCTAPCQEAIKIYPATRGREFHDINPVWSTDGYLLAFERVPQTGEGIHQIFFIQTFTDSIQGTLIRPLATQPSGWTLELFFASYLSWAVRNGIYYCAYMNQTNLHIGRVEKDFSVKIGIFVKTEMSQNKYPAWSDKHNYIAFTSGATGAGDIYIKSYSDDYLRTGNDVHRDISNARRIPYNDDNALDSMPQWSPDGQNLVLVSKRYGNQDIFRLNGVFTSDALLQRLTDSPEEETNPSWSPDGNYIAFYIISGQDSGGGTCDLWVMTANGEHKTLIENNVYRREQKGPAWIANLPQRRYPHPYLIYVKEHHVYVARIVQLQTEAQKAQINITPIRNLRGYKYEYLTDLDCAPYDEDFRGVKIAYSAYNRLGDARIYWVCLNPNNWTVQQEDANAWFNDTNHPYYQEYQLKK